MKYLKGQIQIGLGVITAGAFILGAFGFAVNAHLKSGEAIERVGSVEGDIKAINVKLDNIKETLDIWKQMQIQSGKLTKDGQPIK